MLRTLVLVAALHGVASADFGAQIEGELGAGDFEVAFVLGPPPGLDVVPADIEARSTQYTRAIASATDPLLRANLTAARADLWLARAIKERILAITMHDDDGEVLVEMALARATRDYRAVAHSELAGWRALDGVLVRYGFALEMMKRPEAMSVYRRLVTEVPASPYAARAHLILGDADVVAKRMQSAMVHYGEVVARARDSKQRAYALFKLGWIELFERGDGQRAFAMFAQSLPLDPKSILAWQLRRVLAKSYALFGKPDDGYETFARIAPEHALALTIELADRLRDNHRWADASVVLDELVRRAPDDERVCDWQRDATRVAYERKDRDDMQVFLQAQRLVRVFDRVRFQADSQVLGECEAAVITYTIDLARVTTNPALAHALTDLFLHAFPDRAAATGRRFAPIVPAD